VRVTLKKTIAVHYDELTQFVRIHICKGNVANNKDGETGRFTSPFTLEPLDLSSPLWAVYSVPDPQKEAFSIMLLSPQESLTFFNFDPQKGLILTGLGMDTPIHGVFTYQHEPLSLTPLSKSDLLMKSLDVNSKCLKDICSRLGVYNSQNSKIILSGYSTEATQRVLSIFSDSPLSLSIYLAHCTLPATLKLPSKVSHLIIHRLTDTPETHATLKRLKSSLKKPYLESITPCNECV
jgi:hypothetical protein